MNKKPVRFILLCLATAIVALSSIAILASCGNLITTILNNSKSTSTAPAPSFSLKTGLYTTTQSLSISSSLEGSTIRFTIDGSDPSSSHGTVYSSPISVSSSVTVKARSFKPNWEDSPIASAVFTITGTVPVPTFTVDTGTYASAQNVTITCSDSAATIRYTVDGSTPSVSHGTVYSAPVSIATSQTLKAVAYRANWVTSTTKTAVYTITGTLSPPVFSPVEGVYTSSPQTVSISSPDSGVTIKYTTDGTTIPDGTHGTVYTSPLSVSTSQTIKAVALKTNWSDSGVSSATFTITGTEPTPILGLSAGTYATTQSLTITCSDASATIRYTTDGSTPSATNGQNYSTALSIATSQTIKAVAVKQDWADSSVASAGYTITGTVAAPTFSIDANTYQGAQSVSLNCTTGGATIYYTIDGTTPTSSSSVYDTALSVFKNETIKAFAHLNTWTDSSVASANYIIQYTVTFNSQGGTSVASVTGLSYNATISAPTAPTRTGYAFGGWYTDAGGTSPWTFATSQVTTNTTLYAKWTFIPVVTTFAGSGTAGYANGTGTAASFNLPGAVAVDSSGNVYVADEINNRIRKITSSGVVSTIAGSGAAGKTNGTSTAASFNSPDGVAVDSSGNVYVADYSNNLIRKISPSGVVTTLAGSGTAGSTNGTGTGASFNQPNRVAVDSSGYVYVADYSNNLIRKISPSGVVTTLAGSGTAGSKNGTGTGASFNSPKGVTVDISGTVYVSDYGNNLIRKISPSGVVTTFAGSGLAGSTNGTGASASFNKPLGLVVDSAGNVYVPEEGNDRIRKISAAGVVTTFAGTGVSGSTNGTTTSATFNYPNGVTVDASGTVFVADCNNNLIRKIQTQ